MPVKIDHRYDGLHYCTDCQEFLRENQPECPVNKIHKVGRVSGIADSLKEAQQSIKESTQ